MAAVTNYGFKLAGVSIPENTNNLKVILDSGDNSSSYLLYKDTEGHYSNSDNDALDLSDTKLATETVTVTDSPVILNAELNTIFGDYYNGAGVTVNGVWLYWNNGDHGYTGISNDVGYVVRPGQSGWEVCAYDLTSQNYPVLAGNYTVEVYSGTQMSDNLTIHSLSENDIGDEYNITIAAVTVSESFIEAYQIVHHIYEGGK